MSQISYRLYITWAFCFDHFNHSYLAQIRVWLCFPGLIKLNSLLEQMVTFNQSSTLVYYCSNEIVINTVMVCHEIFYYIIFKRRQRVAELTVGNPQQLVRLKLFLKSYVFLLLIASWISCFSGYIGYCALIWSDFISELFIHYWITSALLWVLVFLILINTF